MKGEETMRWGLNEGDEEAKLMNGETQTEVAPMALVRIGKSALQFTSVPLRKGDNVQQLQIHVVIHRSWQL